VTLTRRIRTGARGRGRKKSRSAHIGTNLRLWEAVSDAYDERHRRQLSGRHAKAWGFWRVPESRLRLLGRTRGRATLELGCGAGRWSAALATSGASAVGLDLSSSQLNKAKHLPGGGRRVAWVRGNAERLPFRADSFDIVFADWGALTFSDPRKTIPEAARVLRRNGRLVFATSSPFRIVVQNRRTNRMDRKLRYDYFGMHFVRYGRPPEVNFQLTYGEWIRLFRSCGFQVESLVETQTPLQGRTSYLTGPERRWGRRWPLESIWLVIKNRPSR